MKVLLIDNSLDNTGASKALFKAIGELPAGSVECTFVFPEGSRCVKAARELGYQAFDLPMLEISRRKGDLIRYIPRLISNTLRLKKFMRQEGIRIVQGNDIYNMLGLSLKLFAGAKVITHIRRMPESFPGIIYSTWVRLHQRFADRVMPVSAANKRAFTPDPKIEVVYDPLPEAEQLPRFVPRTALNKQVSILYLANYTDGKGQLHALKVLALALKRMPDWTFRIRFHGGNFGLDKNDEYRESLVEFAKREGLSSHVELLGPTNEVEQAMKGHDMVFNLSNSESFSRVTLEALFYGIPIVATDVGGTNEMVIEGKTGLLAPAKDIEAMYSKFEKLLLDDALRTRMSAQAYTFVRDQFGWEHSVAPIMRAYQGLSSSAS